MNTDLAEYNPSFTTRQEFLTWLQENAEPELNETIEGESDEVLAEMQRILQKYSDMRGDYGMLKLSGNLGKSIPDFMEVANKTSGLESGEDKKAFVISSAIALFRLIDRGKSGSEDNISQNTAGGLPPLFEENSSMEETFVRPLAEQAVEQSYQLLKDFGAQSSPE